MEAAAAPARAARRPASPARLGAALLAAGTLPFVAGNLLYAPTPAGIEGPELTCPFRAMTGLPCPLCGSTRAVVLAAHGDAGFAQFNLVAVVALAAVALTGLVLLCAPRAGALRRRIAARTSALLASPGPALLALGVLAWAWTLTHRATIV